MEIASTIAEARAALGRLRIAHGAQARVGLVPTMGAIHEGHLSLVRAARGECQVVAASLFVNPLQFAPGEDLARYPRTFDADCRMLQGAGVDLLFAPAVGEMYPPGASTVVEVQGVGDRLDGASRPGHFRGVATVVAKLFHIVDPEIAYFGQKDAAQVTVLRAMVRDLDMRVRLAVCPIVREPDGLALSSRNRYLSPAEREQALVLRRALQAAAGLAAQGERGRDALRAAVLKAFENEPAVALDYAELVDPETLESVACITKPALLAVAAWVGTTRLIDNVLLSGDEPAGEAHGG